MADDCPPIPPKQYEYLDHPADVQLHSWGENLSEAIEQVVIAMYGYMAEDISTVEPVYSMDGSVEDCADVESMIFRILDEMLFLFNAEPFFIGRVARVLNYNPETHSIQMRSWGETFDLSRHSGGTEIKAITYSNMQVRTDADGKVHIYVIVDI